MSNFSIPNRPAGSDQRHVADIEADFDYITGAMDKVAGDGKLLWRTVTAIPPGFAMSGSSYMFGTSSGLQVIGGNYNATNLNFLYLDAGDYNTPPAGKTLEYYMRLLVVCGTTPGINFTLALYPATVSNPSAGNITPAIGAVVAGSGVNVAAPSNNTASKSTGLGSPFGFPGSGLFTPILTGTGTTAANSETIVEASMWWTWA